jgi:hypothetical protein
MVPQQTGISVIDPISPAIDRVKLILFQPFDLAKWFVIGFCAWLAYLGQRGFGFNFRPPVHRPGHPANLPAQLQELFGVRLPVIIAIGATLFIIFIAIMIVCIWLSSRGHFMFLHCVSLNRSEVKLPWHKFRQQGNSLFLFRIAAGIIFFLCIALFVGTIGLFMGLFGAGNVRSTVSVVVAIVLLMFVLLPVGICCTNTQIHPRLCGARYVPSYVHLHPSLAGVLDTAHIQQGHFRPLYSLPNRHSAGHRRNCCRRRLLDLLLRVLPARNPLHRNGTHAAAAHVLTSLFAVLPSPVWPPV